MADVLSLLGSLAPLPESDFSEFGEVEIRNLARIQQLTGAFLGRNWVTVPHVTHHDEVDVTETEARRAAWNAANPLAKLTPVVLQVRALAAGLLKFPHFNASLSSDGKSLFLKKYCNIGVAVDTPKGLVVPVIRGAGEKSLSELSGILAQMAEKARTKGLSMAEMSGSSMCISSLGHIGGTAFTPIINAPDVAILGTTAIQLRPMPATDGGLQWHKMLPLSLSYDHRVINGADAAKFVKYIGEKLAEPELFA